MRDYTKPQLTRRSDVWNRGDPMVHQAHAVYGPSFAAGDSTERGREVSNAPCLAHAMPNTTSFDSDIRRGGMKARWAQRACVCFRFVPRLRRPPHPELRE